MSEAAAAHLIHGHIDPDGPLRQFINAEHLSDEALADLGQWHSQRPWRPRVYRNFLIDDVARAMAAVLRSLPVWSRCATVYSGPLEVEDIDEADWADHPDRAACHFVARPLVDVFQPGAMDPDSQLALKRFLAFAVTRGDLRTWISAGVGFPLEKRVSFELACYGEGDQITAHQDLFEGRVLAVNFYLDESYRKGTGARLGFRNEVGDEFHVDPVFNTFSLIPIDPGCRHWVEPFTGEGMGRYTVSIGQHRA
jgi:hypothetical protein